jgi:hypothetical protein
MTKRRVHIGNLNIRMSRVAGDPAAIAANIGREVMTAAARLSKGKNGKIDLKEVPIGRTKMSADVGKQIAASIGDRLEGTIGGGQK